ncbi:hypothetical protein D3C76_1572930 [compost metagenome]
MLVDIRSIATDADRPQHHALLITNQHPARRRYHRALAQAVERGEERRALLRIQRQQARALAQGNCTPGLAHRYLRS